MKCRKIILEVFVGIFLITFTSALLWAGEPGDLVMKTIDRGLTILKDPSLSGKEKFGERKRKLWAEISPIFNFKEMSKRALGKHWRELSDEQKGEFVELFTSILKDTYIGKTDTYSGEKIIYLRERQNGNRCKVQSTFITKTGKEISVNFSLLNNGGKWKIYDVIIEGVSLVNNYRSQFNNILVKSSYEDLVQKMQKKKSKKTSTD
ncbi:MAG: phospholipid-binding protein MlaC [Candidatus Scalinduaceae bacterium]